MHGRLPEHAKVFTVAAALYDHLAENHGISPALASERLHYIKNRLGYGAADNVLFDHTGNLYDPVTRQWLGSLTEGGAK
jgi:hypothetical protein